MARRVFFTFHYDGDVWRANQVRNANVVAGCDVAGFFDHSEYEEAKKNTTVTVVLIGRDTASRPWVKYEIEQSIARKNGLLGIHIHHLKNSDKDSSFFRGAKPAVRWGVEFPAYDWDKDLERFRREIEAAGKRGDTARAVR
jgi:hypothetical protein